ncbi:MAG: hypothetical protein KAQ93_04025 [Spirochaetales bacterium]|nr:hypothetical protein [Spirochaetales bacterium]
MEDIKNLLSDLGGVITVSQITEEHKEKIANLEKSYERSGVVGLKNIGMSMVMQCDGVFAILKDASFRLPPKPTVLMVEDYKNNNKQNDNLLKFGDNNYRVIGEEIINKKLPDKKEEYIFISDDFILYPGRRTGKPVKPAYFLVPPIEFAELEEMKELYKIENIISISPSTQADDYIRKICNFSLSDQLATILVGFNKTT